MGAEDTSGTASRYTGAIGVIAALVGLSVLAGWLFGVPLLTRVAPGWPQMAPLTAFWAALCGAALIPSVGYGPARPRVSAYRQAALACAVLVTLLALIQLLGSLLGWHLGLDSLGLAGLAAQHAMRPAIVSPATALGFALLGGALAFARVGKHATMSQILSVLGLLTGWLGFAHYAFGGVPLVPYSQMAMHTTLILMLLGSGGLVLRGDTGVGALLVSRRAGGASARRLLPAALLVPLAAGALTLYAEHHDVLEAEQAFSLFALLSVVAFAGLVGLDAAALERSEEENRRAQEALRASDERIRLIIETSLDAVISIDRDGRITGWSAQAASIFGWTSAEAMGQSLAQTIIPERYRSAHEDGLRRYLTTGEGRLLNRRVEVEALRRDRSEFPVELAITPIRSGAELTFSAFVRDISERRRTEAALRESQQLLEAVIDNSPAVIYVKRLDGRYLLVNRRFEEIFRLSREAILGRTDYDLFAKEAADVFRALDVRVAEAGRALAGEETAPHVDGPHDYISVKAPLADASGKTYATFGISTDITDRKRGEERLKRQIERLRLLDHITRAIAERQDLRSIFQVVVRSLEEELPIDFGCVCFYEMAERKLEVACVGVKSHAIALELALAERARIDIDQNGLSRCVHGELVYESDVAASTFPFPARLARGGLHALVIAPLGVKQSVFGVLVAARRAPDSFTSADCEFLRQLSEHLALAAHQTQLHSTLQQAYQDLRQTQETVMQQERLRALGQMASGIAHDINNALSPAALYAQSLLERDRTLSAEARAYLTVIERAIEDVSGTVARMREFYRPRETELTLAPLDLNALIDQVRELTRARWSAMPQERGIVVAFRMDLAPRLPAIMGAENEIRDALTNLVLNAVDAMSEGGTLTLRSRLEPEGEERMSGQAPQKSVWVEVCDTGIGMSETVRARCLEPFFTTKGERGTGLGLAMVYGMVQRHSAEIEIESAPGRGTTVRLRFPVATLSGGRASAPALESPRPLRILVVDDDPLLLRSLKDTLGSDGHSVATADGGQAGIDEFRAARARGQPFSVVITDLGMPQLDGRAVAAAIKSTAPETPVLLLTGWGQRLQSDGELPAYVDRVLSKPPRLADLRAALAAIRDPPTGSA